MTQETLREKMGESKTRYLHLLYRFNPGLIEAAKPVVLQQIAQNNGEEEKMLAIVRHSISYVSGLGKKAYADYQNFPREVEYVCKAIQPNLDLLTVEPEPSEILPCLITYPRPIERICSTEPTLLLYYHAFRLNTLGPFDPSYHAIETMGLSDLPPYVATAMWAYEGEVLLDNISKGFLQFVPEAESRGIDPDKLKDAIQTGQHSHAMRILSNYLHVPHLVDLQGEVTKAYKEGVLTTADFLRAMKVARDMRKSMHSQKAQMEAESFLGQFFVNEGLKGKARFTVFRMLGI